MFPLLIFYFLLWDWRLLIILILDNILALFKLLRLRLTNIMYLFDNIVMPNDWSPTSLIIHSEDVAWALSFVIIKYHFARNLTESTFLKCETKMISQIANQSIFHINIGKISNIVKLFVNFLFLLIWFLIKLWIFVSTHYWRMQSVCSTCFAHFLHLIII